MNYINRFHPLFFLFSLCLLISLKLLASGSTSGFRSGGRVRCIGSERQALLKFKQGLVDEHDKLSSWDNGDEYDKKECYKWLGVKCSNRTGHVILLDLSQGMFRGKVSLSLLVGLEQLRYLDLSLNNFSGSQIGEAIGSFHRLKYLNLSSAYFAGVVPHQLGNLTNLETLRLGWNDLTTNNLVWLSQLRSLRRLDLSFIELNGTNWLQVIFGLPFLQQLSLEDCKLGLSAPSSLLLPNFSSNSLYDLNMALNNLISSSTYFWLFNISNSLVFLDLYYNDMEGSIPDAFGTMTSLEVIYMEMNHLSGAIPNSFQNLSHLSILYLSGNQFYGPLINITRFSFLTVLDLRDNRFNGSLVQNLVLPPSLEYLDLSGNQITGDLFIMPLLDGLGQHSNLPASSLLRELYLNSNKFTGRLPNSIGQFSNLSILDLSSNSFVGPILEVHFSRLSNLIVLDLAFNSLTFNISHEWVPTFQLEIISLANCSIELHFPQWLKTQNKFALLDLSFNDILDRIPDWLWNLLSNLGHLNLSHNQISGRLPELSQKFVDYYPTIDLSFNNFSGPILSIPPNFTTLYLHKKMLVGSVNFLCIHSNYYVKLLDLSNNLFSGDLPNCWTNMTKLIVLNLANNNFSGRIPVSIGFLSSLRTLHLQNNSFVGEIPSSIKNCSSLVAIDVGGNKLAGNIPSWIGTSLTSLIFLSLPSNNFYGSIPRETCHLLQIQVLDLSGNNITGRIPHCFNNFTCLVQKNCSSSGTTFHFLERVSPSYHNLEGYYMDNIWVQWKRQVLEYKETLHLLKLIDLSNNKLVGQIPEEIASLRGLISLNLSVNHLTGNIVRHIDQMELLESLDLSRNQLFGEIPIGLAHLNYLALLDLSNNNLSGRIPSGTQLQSFNASTYAGNKGLCGPPLEKCPWDVVDHPIADDGKDDDVENEDGFPIKEFYTGIGLGFLVGLSGVVAVLFKDSWRNAYFRILMFICDWFYVASTVYWARLKRMLCG